MTKLHTCYPSSASSKLGIERDSHVISKFKPPKIRIIHIYAPEIIKTDAANFRELVQRLTGKPEDEGAGVRNSKTTAPIKDPMDLYPKKAMIMEDEEEIEDEEEFLNLQNEIRVKNQHQDEEQVEDEIWRRSKSNENKFSGFFDGFSELDGFMEELSSKNIINN
ncbi:hypothetical protein RIF29_38260 [Crotalaria pallida]|uniref:VQ domain-containing protein n=1 Tax=Crotalaria pallida TaxID=3830 RepID=A0AAN9DYZ0_CROPI